MFYIQYVALGRRMILRTRADIYAHAGYQYGEKCIFEVLCGRSTGSGGMLESSLEQYCACVVLQCIKNN